MEFVFANWKRYLVSSGLTFLAGFAVAVLPELNKFTLETLANGGLWGLVFVGVRGGVKLALEAFLVWYKK